MSDYEQHLRGGWVNEVVRIGDTVHRSAGPWTPAVHALLRHLEARGFDAAPRVVGFDERGREVLTYVEGVTAEYPWPPELYATEGLAAMVRLLRRYHGAVADFVPPEGTEWRRGALALQPENIVLHRDAGPWNVVWRAGAPVAFIDWDFAEPGPAINDLAFMLWYAVPLGPEEPDDPMSLDRRERLHAARAAYDGVSVAAVLDAVAAVQAEDLRRTLDLGGLGVEPWASFLARGEEDFIRQAMAWLREHRDRLL